MLSLRELAWMAEGSRKQAWNHTAAMLAMQYNTALGKKRKVRGAMDFHPYAKQMPKKKLSREESRARLDAVFGVKRNA